MSNDTTGQKDGYSDKEIRRRLFFSFTRPSTVRAAKIRDGTTTKKVDRGVSKKVQQDSQSGRAQLNSGPRGSGERGKSEGPKINKRRMRDRGGKGKQFAEGTKRSFENTRS